MANYRTCHNCRVDPKECATRDIIKRAIAGLHVTSIKFNCPDRAPLYRAGDRVNVTWLVSSSVDDYYQNEYSQEIWPATVIQEVGPKFLILVDDVDSDEGTPARGYIKSDTLYCKVSAGKLMPLNEPRRTVCDLCGIVAGNSFNACWQEGTRPDPRCLRSILAQVGTRPEGQDPQGLDACTSDAVGPVGADAPTPYRQVSTDAVQS